MRSYSQLQAHEIIVIPPDDPVLPSPAFSKVAHRLTASNSAPTAPDARPRSPVELLVVSAKPQSPHVMEPGTTSSSSEDEDAGQVLPPALPASPRIPTTPAHQKLIVVTPIAPIAPLPPSPSPSQKTPAAAATTTITATTAAVAPAHSSGSPTDSVEVNTPYDVPPAYESLGLSDHDKSVRRGRASGLGASLLSPTSPQTSPLSKGDNSLSRGGDVLVVDSMAPAIQPSKTVCAGTDPISAAHDQSQSDLTTQVEALKAQLNRLQRQCDQNTGLMQLKDWVTTLWMKRTRKWEARAAELEQDRDQLREELKHTKQRKVFWRRTATERLTASHQWVDLCQEQTKEIVDLKQRSVVQQGKIEMLEVLLDEAGSVASTASTELARSVDGLEDPEDADEQVDMQPQNPSAAHPSFSTRTSYLSTISAVSSGSGSSAAESYTNDFDVEDDDYPSPPSATPPSCSSPPPLAPAESDPEPAPTHSKEELENLLAELRAGQEEFEVHLAKYAADRKALKEGWDELAEAQDRLQDEYEDFDASVRASDEAVARRTAAHERRANMLIDQEMELDLLKRRYVDKVRNYERISIDLKRREDHFFSRTDHVHLLAEDVEQSRMQNEATRCVLREEWNEVEYAWMAVWRRQNRLVKAAQLCQCPCVCGNRGDVESWNDDEVPALLLGEAGRENERANKVRAIVEEEIWKRRDEERNEGRRLRCVRDCECPECMPEDVESPVFNDAPPDQDGLHGLALELPVASCPPSQVVPPVEGEADVRPPNRVVHEEEEFQRQREEEAVHREEAYVEGNSGEWEEGRLSSSLELRSASPKPLPVIPDSPNARAELYLLEEDMFIVLDRGLTWHWFVLSCPASLPVGNNCNIQSVTNNHAPTPIHQATIQLYLAPCLASHEQLFIALPASLAHHVLETTIRHSNDAYEALVVNAYDPVTL